MGPDTSFDGEEDEADVDTICMVKTISRQLTPSNPKILAKESSKDPIVSSVMRYVREGWPSQESDAVASTIADFRKLEISLTVNHGCLFYGLRVVIPSSLREQVLQLLHLGHFGMQG